MNIKGIIKGAIFALIIAILPVFFSALLTYFNIINERTAVIISFAGVILGVFFGSLGCVKTSEARLLINSMSLCLFFSIILFLISSFINNGIYFDIASLSLYGSIFFAGFLAVMFGK